MLLEEQEGNLELVSQAIKIKIDEVLNVVRCSNFESLEKALHKKFKANRIPQTEGTLIIYLFDSRYAFNQDRNPPDDAFNNLVQQEGYDLEIPIVGYAIGFPQIEPDPGREYVHGNYDLELEEEGQEETVEFEGDFAVPDDDEN